MKIFTLLSMFSVLAFSCSTTRIAYQQTGEVEYIRSDGDNTMLVESNGFGSTIEDAVFFAEKNAIENLFYQGLPNSNQQVPMIPDEQKAKTEHSLFFDSFFSSGEYRKYIISSFMVRNSKSGAGKSVTQEIKLNVSSLRSRLEKEKIIRSFGI